MQVYVELALLENFCMDFTLLYCAKLVAKNRAHILRLVIASVFGACFAVVFMCKMAAFYLKNKPHSTPIKIRLFKSDTTAEVRQIIEETEW